MATQRWEDRYFLFTASSQLDGEQIIWFATRRISELGSGTRKQKRRSKTEAEPFCAAQSS
jgi:hypothetical protein